MGRWNLFVDTVNFPIHLMQKYTLGWNSDGSNFQLKAGSTGVFFNVKNALMARTKESVRRLILIHYYRDNDNFALGCGTWEAISCNLSD